MAAGVFGYLGYDMVRLMEELPPPNPDPVGIPDAVLVRPTIIVVFDAVKDSITVVTPVRPEQGVDAKAALARAVERLNGVVESLDRPLDKSLAEVDTGPLEVRRKSNTTPDEYKAMVLKAKDYIAAGDVFQIVLAQRFEAPFTLPPFSLYRALRRTNPSPYLYFLDFGGFAVAGSSPEILVKVAGDTVTIRPIAGTRPRGATPHEDKALEDELLADPKERAEHLMLLDLGRNDVGRVAEIGTVKVTDQFFVERYSHVMHIVSNVEGRLDANHDALDALAAGFPAGTVSGAPKVRAMQIIDELEKEKRGLYAGCGRLFLRRRRDGHLHRAAHRAGQGRHHVCAGRRRHRRRQRSRLPSSRNASTRRRPCSAPPRKRADLPAPPSAGNNRHGVSRPATLRRGSSHGLAAAARPSDRRRHCRRAMAGAAADPAVVPAMAAARHRARLFARRRTISGRLSSRSLWR